MSRPLPGVPVGVSPETDRFWAAGAAGDLVVEECLNCGVHSFPPRGVCRRCHSRELRFTPVRPPGVVYASTVNHNAWYPDGPAVFPLVLVEFPEFSGVRFVGRYATVEGAESTGARIDDRVGFELVAAFDGQFQLVFSAWESSGTRAGEAS